MGQGNFEFLFGSSKLEQPFNLLFLFINVMYFSFEGNCFIHFCFLTSFPISWKEYLCGVHNIYSLTGASCLDKQFETLGGPFGFTKVTKIPT